MKKIIVELNDANQRLDKFLKKLFPNATLGLIFKLNRKEKIKVNSKRKDNEYKLQVGDEIKIFVSDEDFILLSKAKEEENKIDVKLDKRDIIMEDADILVINKNPWLIVHPWDYKTKEVSLIEQVQDYLWDKLNSLTFKPALVHRIDKDTSGIILIAKNKPSLDNLLKQLQDNKIDKYYQAVCLWNPTNNDWIINKKLLRIENAKNENKVSIDEKNWQKAVTHYRVLRRNIKWKYSLLECKLETWRMHQIRVHLASVDLPIIGDKTYGNKSENYFANREYWVDRQFLHAQRVSFIHPTKKTKITLEAKLKDDMKRFLEA